MPDAHSVQDNFRELRDLIQSYARAGGPGDPWYDGEVALGRIEEQLGACEAARASLSQSADHLQNELEKSQEARRYVRGERDRLLEQLEALKRDYLDMAAKWDGAREESAEHERSAARLEREKAGLLEQLEAREKMLRAYVERFGLILPTDEPRAEVSFPATEPNEEEDDGLDPLRLDDVDGADPATGISDAELLRRVEKHTEPSPATKLADARWPWVQMRPIPGTESDPAKECDGTRYCVADKHIHGCFAERGVHYQESSQP